VRVRSFTLRALVAAMSAAAFASCSSAAPPPASPDGATASVILVKGTFAGKVMAPNGTLPLANALVYFTPAAPPPLPDVTYCDDCVAVTSGSYAISASDGSFEIPNVPTSSAWLVVQKGQFRRVRELTRQATGEGSFGGALAVPSDALTLPGKSNPASGDHVPTMAVLVDDGVNWDYIDVSLTKLGFTGFDMKRGRSLLSDAAALMRYQIVFVPCGGQADPAATDPVAQANLKNFVRAGGRLYATDWSYEFVRQPFPGFLSWENESSELGSAASREKWEGAAEAVDPGLRGWLAATGNPTFDVVGNWTNISGVHSQAGLDPKGNATTITPKVWVTAASPLGVRPTTVSFESGCGRVLFSTYHAEGGGAPTELLAQEKALIHVLLEVGVCVGSGGDAGQAPGVR
jgi:hypothetical protein